MVPVNKQSHLRPLATINQINKCVTILKSKPKIKRSMWSRRAQEYEAKISSGKIYDLTEVVRDLNKGDDLMIDQSYSERQLFEKAYDRLLTEFQIVIGASLEDAQKKIDKALKRNLEAQKPQTPIKPKEKIAEASEICRLKKNASHNFCHEKRYLLKRILIYLLLFLAFFLVFFLAAFFLLLAIFSSLFLFTNLYDSFVTLFLFFLISYVKYLFFLFL